MKERRQKLLEELDKIGAEAFLVANSSKIRYLTGFSGEGCCLVTLNGVYLITDNRYGEQALKEARECQVEIFSSKRKASEIVNNLLASCKRVCFEPDMSYGLYRLLKGPRLDDEFFPVPGTPAELALGFGLVDKLAAVKDGDEVDAIQEAIRLTEHVFEHHVLPQVRPGVTEKDLASEITWWGAKHGAERDAFDIIAASGTRSSLPHGCASPKTIEKGDMVQFDFGYMVRGYPSDFSRVVFTAEPTAEQKKIYDIVLTAQEMAIKAARPGIKCGDLDKVARDYIKSYGYDIPHGLGHGLGILIHTSPRIGPDEKVELRPGHVITIEPGIYIPDWGGIRIEDVIVITEDGCRNLTKFTRELIVTHTTPVSEIPGWLPPPP